MLQGFVVKFFIKFLAVPATASEVAIAVVL